MTTQNPPPSQTRSFMTIWMIELWERFGYYGMQALIVYYMVQRLGFEDERANLVWSASAALIYVSPAIGGWVGDKILGTRRTMLLGVAILAIGYALMTVPSEDTWSLFGALGVIVVGNGLFKPNAANLVRKIYDGNDAKIDSAFTMYYMAVNVGSTVSMLLTPWIKDYVNRVYGHNLGWHAAFGVCCVGLGVGMTNYWLMRRAMAHIGSKPDYQPLRIGRLVAVLLGGAACVAGSAAVLQYETLARIFVYAAGVVLLGIFSYLIAKSHKSERAGLIAALVLVVQTIFFFIFYQQMSTSLALFALRNVDWHQIFLRRAVVDLDAGAVPGPESALDHAAEPGPGLGIHQRGQARQGSVDRDEIRIGICGRRRRILHLCRRRQVRHGRHDLVVVHDLGLRLLLARRAVGQRSRIGDDRALRAGADGRLHDGRVFRRFGNFAVSRRRRRQFRQHTEPARRSAENGAGAGHGPDSRFVPAGAAAETGRVPPVDRRIAGRRCRQARQILECRACGAVRSAAGRHATVARAIQR